MSFDATLTAIKNLDFTQTVEKEMRQHEIAKTHIYTAQS